MQAMIEDKIRTVKELSGLVKKLKEQGSRIVFTNGCFDIVHYGHVKYLEDAKKEGDVLIVAVNSDSSVRAIKDATRPIVDERSRIRVIAALESVDYAVLFSDSTPLETIKAIIPDVLVKGGDWDVRDIVGSDVVTASGGKVKAIPFVDGYSSTNIISKIKKSVS